MSLSSIHFSSAVSPIDSPEPNQSKVQLKPDELQKAINAILTDGIKNQSSKDFIAAQIVDLVNQNPDTAKELNLEPDFKSVLGNVVEPAVNSQAKLEDKIITGPLGGKYLAPPNVDLEKNAELAKKMSLAQFKDKLQSGGVWDYKDKSNWADKKYRPKYAPFGNFHYGYVCAAKNISLEFTRRIAGVVQIKTLSDDFKREPTLKNIKMLQDALQRLNDHVSYGDNFDDIIPIMEGWLAYQTSHVTHVK